MAVTGPPKSPLSDRTQIVPSAMLAALVKTRRVTTASPERAYQTTARANTTRTAVRVRPTCFITVFLHRWSSVSPQTNNANGNKWLRRLSRHIRSDCKQFGRDYTESIPQCRGEPWKLDSSFCTPHVTRPTCRTNLQISKKDFRNRPWSCHSTTVCPSSTCRTRKPWSSRLLTFGPQSTSVTVSAYTATKH